MGAGYTRWFRKGGDIKLSQGYHAPYIPCYLCTGQVVAKPVWGSIAKTYPKIIEDTWLWLSRSTEPIIRADRGLPIIQTKEHIDWISDFVKPYKNTIINHTIKNIKEKNMTAKFWVVMKDDNIMVTKVRHLQKDIAIKEAERLAKQNKDTKFFVAEIIGYGYQPETSCYYNTM